MRDFFIKKSRLFTQANWFALAYCIGFNALVVASKPHCTQQIIDLSAKTVSITLSSNPSTGYQWQLASYDTTQFKLVDKTFTPSSNHQMGSSGFVTFNFSTLRDTNHKKTSQMMFDLSRAWEKTPVSQRCIQVIWR